MKTNEFFDKLARDVEKAWKESERIKALDEKYSILKTSNLSYSYTCNCKGTITHILEEVLLEETKRLETIKDYLKSSERLTDDILRDLEIELTITERVITKLKTKIQKEWNKQ